MELKCIPEANKKNYLNNSFFFTCAMNQKSFPLAHVGLQRRDLHLWVHMHLCFTGGGGVM